MFNDRLFRKTLLAWYRKHARAMPWRQTHDPYKIWLSEIMLQQTQVATVIPYYNRFIKQFPDVNRLAKASDDHVMKLWEGLGYYRRAHHMLKAARLIRTDRKGVFPTSAEGLLELPGIGQYSAHAIASIAYGEVKAVLDGNVKRVLARIYAIPDSIDTPTCIETLWELAQGLISEKKPGDYNQAIMELGALICKPKQPLCSTCPVRKVCKAYQTDCVGQLPVRRKKKKVPHYNVVAGVIAKQDKILIGKRKADGMLANLWEFPGGKIKSDETPVVALKREILEETGLVVRVGECVATIKHAYTHFKITLQVYRCQWIKGRAQRHSHQALKWIRPADLEKYAFPNANRKIIPEIINQQ